MRPERPGAGAEWMVLVRTARTAGRSGLAWGAGFGVYVAASAYGYSSTYPTVASRIAFARSLSTNTGIAALLGPARHLETVAGFTAWRTMGVLSVVGAVWGLLLATRLTRGEEDEGRWELLLSGWTTRGRAAAQAAAGLGAGLACVWAVMAVLTVAAGSSVRVRFGTTSSLFLATALVAGATVFAAVGLFAAQLAASRRRANAIGAGVLGASFLVRMVADSGSGLTWARWATPLGWIEHLQPLTGSTPFPLLPIAALVLALAVTSVVVAARRDLGSSLLPARDAPPPRTFLLNGPTGLTVRLGWATATGWVMALAVLGLVLGLVAQSASKAISGSAGIERALRRLGGHRGGAATYLGLALVIAAALVTFVAAGQIAATSREETDGHLDNLLVRPVARWRWLAGRLALAAVLIVAAGVATGVAAWAGAATQAGGVGIGSLTQAGVNIAPPALLVLGLGAAVYGFRPSLAAAAVYVVVVWSLLVELVGSVVPGSGLLLDASVIAHVAPAPAANPDWASAAWLVGLGLAGAGAGMAGFSRRDVVGR